MTDLDDEIARLAAELSLGNVAIVPMAAILASRYKGGLQAVL